MMKLLFLLDTPKYRGGGDYSIFKFAENLSNDNEVTLVTTKNANSYLSKNHNCQIIIRNEISSNLKGVGRINSLIDLVHIKFKVEPLIKIKKFDFIIGYLTWPAIKALKLGKKYSIPVVNFHFETPNWLAEELGNEWVDQYKGKYKNLWEKTKLAYQQSDILLSNSKLSKKKCEAWIKKKVNNYVYPGVEEIALTENLKEENQIIYIGRLIKSKNVDLIIKALSKIKNHHSLVIIGDGHEKINLESLSKKLKVSVEFKGTVSDKDKWNEIKKSMFMVFSTSFEGFGMPPMEALACEKPCICSDIPILREIYKNSVEYFKEKNVRDLIKKINFLINNPAYRKRRSKEGRKFVLSRYSWEKSARKIEKILNNYKNEKSKI